jgi:hypothetical protein
LYACTHVKTLVRSVICDDSFRQKLCSVNRPLDFAKLSTGKSGLKFPLTERCKWRFSLKDHRHLK